jgi:hypothetical protein
MTMYHEAAHAGALHGCREVACVETRRLLNGIALRSSTPVPELNIEVLADALANSPSIPGIAFRQAAREIAREYARLSVTVDREP